MSFREDNPDGITRADIIVGIPSYNEASRISFPTQQADKGLSKYYSERSAVIINCDNCSPDNTRQAFMQTATKTPKMYLSTENGVTGKGNNIKNLILKAVELSAQAVMVVDADLMNMTPLWIRNLGEPLFENYHLVAPLYVRHKYDGSFTNNIIYPLTRALYGRRVRQPVGGEVGFSGELARIYKDESNYCDEAVGNFGISIWMTTVAMRHSVSVIQSFMGKAKIHRVRDVTSDAAKMFRDVLGTLFELMCRYDRFWKDVKWSRPTAVFGFGIGDVEVPPPVEIDIKSLSDEIDTGLKRNWNLYKEFVNPQNFNKMEEVAGLPQDGFELPTNLWAKILYDFAVAYRNRAVPHDDLLGSLIPLYYAKTLSFVLETEAMNTQQVEEFIEDQCLHFEKTKPYLLERWFR